MNAAIDKLAELLSLNWDFENAVYVAANMHNVAEEQLIDARANGHK